VDECGVDQFLYREHGYAPRGQKVVGEISGKKFKRVNFCAGICQNSWIAPVQYSGTTDSMFFEWWFEFCLLPALKPGSTIVLDNATFHRKSTLPGLAAAQNCAVIFLPPYSPDLNPIEHKWAWLKRRLRKILRNFNSFDDAAKDCFQVS